VLASHVTDNKLICKHYVFSKGKKRKGPTRPAAGMNEIRKSCLLVRSGIGELTADVNRAKCGMAECGQCSREFAAFCRIFPEPESQNNGGRIRERYKNNLTSVVRRARASLRFVFSTYIVFNFL